jgi:hypothetical protein
MIPSFILKYQIWVHLDPHSYLVLFCIIPTNMMFNFLGILCEIDCTSSIIHDIFCYPKHLNKFSFQWGNLKAFAWVPFQGNMTISKYAICTYKHLCIKVELRKHEYYSLPWTKFNNASSCLYVRLVSKICQWVLTYTLLWINKVMSLNHDQFTPDLGRTLK